MWSTMFGAVVLGVHTFYVLFKHTRIFKLPYTNRYITKFNGQTQVLSHTHTQIIVKFSQSNQKYIH